MGEVVNLADFRGMRVARALERHFGLPRGAAVVHNDPWAERHGYKPRANPHSPMNTSPLMRPGRDAGSIADMPVIHESATISQRTWDDTVAWAERRLAAANLIEFAKTGAPPENPRSS